MSSWRDFSEWREWHAPANENRLFLPRGRALGLKTTPFKRRQRETACDALVVAILDEAGGRLSRCALCERFIAVDVATAENVHGGRIDLSEMAQSVVRLERRRAVVRERDVIALVPQPSIADFSEDAPSGDLS